MPAKGLTARLLTSMSSQNDAHDSSCQVMQQEPHEADVITWRRKLKMQA